MMGQNVKKRRHKKRVKEGSYTNKGCSTVTTKKISNNKDILMKRLKLELVKDVRLGIKDS